MFKINKSRDVTPFNDNPNHFNILNSYYGYNSIYKSWFGVQDICFNDGNNRLINGSNKPIPGFEYESSGVPTVNRFDNNIWNEWPKIDETFATGFQSPKWLPTLQPSKPLPQSSNQWTTSFWDNIVRGSDRDVQQNIDINNNNKNSEMEYKTNGSISGSDRYGFSNNQWDNKWPQQPIGTTTQFDSVRGQSFDVNNPLSQEPFIGISRLANSWYVQPRIRRRLPTLTECVFCKNNNERPEFYRSHVLKDPESNIQCPVLRSYDCPICHNGGGPKAHTIRYCPLNKAGLQAKLEKFMESRDDNEFDWNNNFNKNDFKKNRKFRNRYK